MINMKQFNKNEKKKKGEEEIDYLNHDFFFLATSCIDKKWKKKKTIT